MVKKISLIMFLLFTFNISKSYSKAGIGLHVGAGQNFSGLGVATIRVSDYELGLVGRLTFGLHKLFYMGTNFYSLFGIGYVLVDNSPGIHAGVGWNYNVFSRVGVRLEFDAIQSVKAYSEITGTFGVTWNF